MRKEEFISELRSGILPFWMGKMADGGGSFHGRMTGTGELEPQAPKGAIMYGRILWTFAAAYRVFGDKEYLATADAAKNYLISKFYDRLYGGVYWSLDANGNPLDTKKQFYALGFAIYGLSEYHRATGDVQALEYAIKLFESIEEHSFDRLRNGYIEAATRDWQEIGDQRLSAKDANEKKSMNTHLHILEPYTNLYRVWKDKRLERQLRNLIGIFLDKIESPQTHHLGLFFDEEWNEKSTGTYSYGHDIEASWLILEAVMELGDPALTEKAKSHCADIAAAAMQGYMPDGSMIYEHHADGGLDKERHWWVQAETVVGLLWMWKYHGDQSALDKAEKTWEYIKTQMIDRREGEWFWSVMPDGSINRRDDKAGFWKCPYHNGRMCLEAISIL